MANGLLERIMPGGRFPAGWLPGGPLARALGIRECFASCGTDPVTHDCHHDSASRWIFLATLAGCGSVRLAQTSWEAEPLTLFIMPPETRFSETVSGKTPWSWICLQLDPDRDSPLAEILPSAPWIGRPGRDCFHALGDFTRLLADRPRGFELAAMAELLEILTLTGYPAQGGQRAPSPFVEESLARMRSDLACPWTVDTLARYCHMSPSSFAHRFKQETGTTPKQWLAEERIRAARRLLADGLSIDAIAARLGFCSRYHFTRVFTRCEGMPPGRFQRLALRR